MRITVKSGQGKPENPYSGFINGHSSNWKEGDKTFEEKHPSLQTFYSDFSEVEDGVYDGEVAQICWTNEQWKFCNQGVCCLNDTRQIYLIQSPVKEVESVVAIFETHAKRQAPFKTIRERELWIDGGVFGYNQAITDERARTINIINEVLTPYYPKLAEMLIIEINK